MNQIAENIADKIIQVLGPDALNLDYGIENEYDHYRFDPTGFIKNELNINLTDDISRMLDSVRDNKITIARSATGTGKSHGAACAAVWFYKAYGPESRVYTVANPFENQKILWGEISEIVEKNSKLFEKDKVITHHVERSQNDFITALNMPTTGTDEVKEAKFSGKHRKHMLFIVDEGDAVSEFAYRGIEGCMSGGVVVRILIMFNPRNKANIPSRYERDGLANVVHISAFDHPNVITGEHVIPGAVSREETVRRINDYCRLAKDGEDIEEGDSFYLPEYLVGCTTQKQNGKEDYPPLKAGLYVITEPVFYYMVLGEYPPQGEDQLISEKWIYAARMRWDMWVQRYGEVPPRETKGIAGLDVGEFGNDPSAWCARYGGWLTRFKDWTGVDTNYTSDKACKLARSENISCTMVDGNGVGAGVAPNMMRKGKPARGVKTQEGPDDRELEPEFGEFKILRDQLAWQVREWLRTDPTSMLPPDEELIEELSIPTYKTDGKYVRIMKADVFKDLLKRSPNKFSALCLTFAKVLDVGGQNSGKTAQHYATMRAKYSRYGRN
jgi:hypothetical protein